MADLVPVRALLAAQVDTYFICTLFVLYLVVVPLAAFGVARVQ